MNRFFIQVLRGDGWRNITTIAFDPKITRRNGYALPVKDALVEARRQLHSWSLYKDFHGEKLRIAEHGRKGQLEAV